MSIIHITTLILLILISKIGSGQELAIIKDKDGYVNVRDKAIQAGKVIGKVLDGDIFYVETKDSSDWVTLWFLGEFPTRNELAGYIHKSRFTPFSKLKKYDEKLGHGNSDLIITSGSILFQIILMPFDSTRHKILKSKGGDPWLDNRPSYGNFDRLPTVEIQNIKLVIDGAQVTIPTQAYDDLYEINLSRMHLVTDNRGRIYIYSSNSDGAGGYELVWVFKNGKYEKRHVLIP